MAEHSAPERGMYVVIEGSDGAGTTTQRELLLEHLREQGIAAIGVSEPGGTPIGRELRAILLNPDLGREPATSLDLFMAARRELAAQVISRAIAEGTWVISDRNWVSSFAYQGVGEGMDTRDIVLRAQSALGQYFTPDSTIIVDVPVAEARARLRLRQGHDADDHFERKGAAFFERVRKGYLLAAERYGFGVVDGRPEPGTVHREIVARLGALMCREE